MDKSQLCHLHPLPHLINNTIYYDIAVFTISEQGGCNG
jgi:hypothetical protein